jgi:GntP family gluconate:H+ symporter
MHTLIAFLIALAFVSVLGIRFRVMPFISLIAASLLYGVLVGMELDRILAAITAGTGRIFGLFGIVIFCGAVIAEVLREGGYLQRILNDIRRFARRPVHTSGVAGYLLAVPLMCSITAFIILPHRILPVRGYGEKVRSVCRGIGQCHLLRAALSCAGRVRDHRRARDFFSVGVVDRCSHDPALDHPPPRCVPVLPIPWTGR